MTELTNLGYYAVLSLSANEHYDLWHGKPIEAPVGTALHYGVVPDPSVITANEGRASVVVALDPEERSWPELVDPDDREGWEGTFRLALPVRARPCEATFRPPALYDEKAVYDAELRRLVDWLYERCRELNLPCFVRVEYAQDERATTAHTAFYLGFNRGRRPSPPLVAASTLCDGDEGVNGPLEWAMLRAAEELLRSKFEGLAAHETPADAGSSAP